MLNINYWELMWNVEGLVYNMNLDKTKWVFSFWKSFEVLSYKEPKCDLIMLTCDNQSYNDLSLTFFNEMSIFIPNWILKRPSTFGSDFFICFFNFYLVLDLWPLLMLKLFSNSMSLKNCLLMNLCETKFWDRTNK